MCGTHTIRCFYCSLKMKHISTDKSGFVFDGAKTYACPSCKTTIEDVRR